MNDDEVLATVRSIFGREPTDEDEAAVYDQVTRCLEGEHKYQNFDVCICCGDTLWGRDDE